MTSRMLNAAKLRQGDARNWIEFETICRPEWVELGFGDLGAPVMIKGVLMAVVNNHPVGRAWSVVAVRTTAPATRTRTEIVAVLHAHRWVTLTDLDG